MNEKSYDKKDLTRICRDCLAMYWIPVLLYAAESVAREVLQTYSATVLGGFADYALGGSMEEGMADLRRILVSVGLSIVLPLLFWSGSWERPMRPREASGGARPSTAWRMTRQSLGLPG